MSFTVSQEKFSGPLQILLELLDKKELEIKDVALAEIANDYLDYMDKTEVPPEALADFLVIASRLIYLKSRELMPFLRIDEEDEKIENLEDQLRLYRLFIEAAGRLEERFIDSARILSRPKTKIELKSKFSPGSNITSVLLKESFVNLLKKLEPFFALQRVSMERVKSVEERLEELRGAITNRAKMSFRDVTNGATSRVDIVVSFLALLELVRRQIVKAKQGDSDIMIERI